MINQIVLEKVFKGKIRYCTDEEIKNMPLDRQSDKETRFQTKGEEVSLVEANEFARLIWDTASN